MRRAIFLLLLIAAAGPSCRARATSQSQPRSRAKPNPDRLGMTCTQILQMTSSDWIAKFSSTNFAAANAPAQDSQLRAIRVYGECYDERTNHLAVSLGRNGKGPLMGARGDFGDFDNALKDFSAKALAATSAPADAVKTAYAALYEKQFRYAFYQSYERKPPRLSRSSSPAATASTAAAAPPTSSSGTSSSSARADGRSVPNSADPLARAKNRFGELLAALPEDKLHEVHAAFENVMVAHPVDSATELAVCRYAIFVLEPPPPPANSAAAHRGPANPFSPPPF
jgi:hypothetical protein